MGEGRRALLFKPGQSGNPSGQPKEAKILREFAYTKAMRALEVAVEILENTEAKNSERLEAVKIILDRAMGKPAQAVDLTGSVENPLMSAATDQLLKFVNGK